MAEQEPISKICKRGPCEDSCMIPEKGMHLYSIAEHILSPSTSHILYWSFQKNTSWYSNCVGSKLFFIKTFTSFYLLIYLCFKCVGKP